MVQIVKFHVKYPPPLKSPNHLNWFMFECCDLAFKPYVKDRGFKGGLSVSRMVRPACEDDLVRASGRGCTTNAWCKHTLGGNQGGNGLILWASPLNPSFPRQALFHGWAKDALKQNYNTNPEQSHPQGRSFRFPESKSSVTLVGRKTMINNQTSPETNRFA